MSGGRRGTAVLQPSASRAPRSPTRPEEHEALRDSSRHRLASRIDNVFRRAGLRASY